VLFEYLQRYANIVDVWQHRTFGVFYRSYNMKRAIGLLGVVLALLSGVQQGHSFCFLAGCVSPSSSVDAKADCLGGACSCSRRSSERQVKCSPSSGVESPDAGQSCPCPPTCWCHQSPGPLGLPTSASAERLSQSLGQSHTLITASVGCDQGSTRNREATVARSVDGAMVRCAKLCRFLI